MTDEVKEKAKKTAELYFGDFPGGGVFPLWKHFDSDLAKDLSRFITGQMYAREKIPHQTRQLITVAVLTALGRAEELKLHTWAALNVGCTPAEIAEVIFQVFTYAGMPVVNQGLKVLKQVLEERGLEPGE